MSFIRGIIEKQLYLFFSYFLCSCYRFLKIVMAKEISP